MKKLKINNNEKWLFVTDLDGTFHSQSPNMAIPALNIKAVRELKKQGHIFVLASGRSPHLMSATHKQLELDTPMVSFHGALITDPTNTHPEFPLNDNFIEKDLVKEIMLDLDMFEDSISTHIVAPNKVIEISTKEDLEIYDFDCYEAVFVFDRNKIDEEKTVKALVDKWGDRIGIKFIPAGSGLKYDLLLLVHKGTDKSNALKKLSEYYDIPKERIVYFGDNLNDLKAIIYAGHGVAVSSGLKAVKMEADYITDIPSWEGGVGKFILDALKD